ncbi:MAG: hypothetical protein EHM17_10025 [Verrucomicrobiaceae bacterium]|nr:MAG: hypothetical protein EHM17_15955 [Verrucomicrobiaceae bacterium]RPJ33517.1 MAG: hypothetical protein EHM17_10025 [Verrucomicrobiaceae bacterium]
MKLGQFVTTSSLVLTGWLGFTFVNEVPAQRYPKLDRYTHAPPQAPAPGLPEDGLQPELFQVSLSH